MWVGESIKVYSLTYFTAELLNFMKNFVQIFVELFKLQHGGGISLLKVQVNGQRVRLLNTGNTRVVGSGLADELILSYFKLYLYQFLSFCVHFF